MAETFDQAQYYAKQAERTSDSMPEADKRTLLGTVEGTVAKGSNLLRTLGGAIREKVATLDEANQASFEAKNVKALSVMIVSKLTTAGFNVDLVKPDETIFVDFAEGTATVKLSNGEEFTVNNLFVTEAPEREGEISRSRAALAGTAADVFAKAPTPWLMYQALGRTKKFRQHYEADYNNLKEHNDYRSSFDGVSKGRGMKKALKVMLAAEGTVQAVAVKLQAWEDGTINPDDEETLETDDALRRFTSNTVPELIGAYAAKDSITAEGSMGDMATELGNTDIPANVLIALEADFQTNGPVMLYEKEISTANDEGGVEGSTHTYQLRYNGNGEFQFSVPRLAWFDGRWRVKKEMPSN